MTDHVAGVEEVLIELSADKLFKLCERLNIEAPATMRATRMRSKVIDYLEAQLEEAKGDEDSLFAHIYEVVKTVQSKGDTSALEAKTAHEEEQQQRLADGRPSANAFDSNQLPGIYHPTARAQLTDAYRRQFRLTGTIGGEGGLSYSSIVSQVGDGQRQGYRDHEIVAGLKLATSAKVSRLRGFLDIKASLTVEKLLKYVREHLQEKTATELLDELSKLTQAKDESAIDFMIRCFEVREKVSAATQVEDYKLDPKLIHNKFCRSACTGFTNETIRARMKMMLDPTKPTVEDEDLLKELNVASSECKETEEKHKRDKVVVKVVQFEEQGKDLLEKVARLTREVEYLKSKPTEPTAPARRQRYGGGGRCKPCREGRKEVCKHCFKCGGEDGHFARDCTKPENSQGLRK